MKTMITAGLLIVLGAAPALAEGDQGKKIDEHVDKAFARLDTDKDGRISRAEADAAGPRLAKHFDQVDADKDGFVTRAELKAALEKLKRRQ